MRNILIVRSGEKRLNEYYIATCKEVMKILEEGYVKAF
jgi:hypothetical protein